MCSEHIADMLYFFNYSCRVSVSQIVDENLISLTFSHVYFRFRTCDLSRSRLHFWISLIRPTSHIVYHEGTGSKYPGLEEQVDHRVVCPSCHTRKKESPLTCSNLFETSPTNAQLVLGVLRDAEHRRDPLPPAPHPDDDLDSTAVKETGYAHHEHVDDSDGEDDDDDDDSAKDKREKIVGKISSAGAKGKDTTRAKARKAWDKIGKAKEEVSLPLYPTSCQSDIRDLLLLLDIRR
jgi:hypothetical protein